MHAEWDLSDGTRVEAKLVDLGKWSVRVNDSDVASASTRLSFFENDTSFTLPDGRKAVMSMRKTLYGPEVDLHVDGRAILYPGRRPFRCPACRIATRADEETCASCQAALPDRAHRIQARRFRGVALSMAYAALLPYALALTAVIGAVRDPSPAMARLASIHSDSPADELREFAVSGAWSKLGDMTIYLIVLLGLILLSRRAPLIATAINLALWLGAAVVYALEASTSAIGLILPALLSLMAVRPLRIALQIRAAEASFRQQKSA